ncbi:MAG: hypothetical protein IJ300_12935 [Clostridia bacterium]|nr:hypothetical protein [Clostridia bacterium]
MFVESVRIQGQELILKSPDYSDIRRFAYNFKAGNYEIEKKRKKRSNDANALCWKLCTEIANVLRAEKESIYVDMLKRYGQSDIVSVLSSVDVKGYFKYYDEFGKGTVNEKEFTHYKVYKGSSEYDTKEMSILIDGIIDEAKALEIEVISEREKSLLLEEWGNG